MSSQFSIDICIVNYFSAGDVHRCLSVLGHWPHGTIWLVDNSNDAGEASSLRDATRGLPGVALVSPGVNLGFGRGCNLAFEQSRAPLFLLLNPDARISEADLLSLAALLVQKPELGAVSPRIFWNEQRSFLLPTAFPQSPTAAMAQTVASHSRALAVIAARSYLRRQTRLMAAQAAFDVPFLAGAVMMLRRQAVEDAGGLFDPDYFMFYEDSDLSLRLRWAGYRLALLPAASAVHEYRHKAFKADLMAESRKTYFRKRYPRFFAVSSGLRRLDQRMRPVPVEQWFDVLPQTCLTAGDFNRQTDGASVLAFSPSMLMVPAIFRPSEAVACAFDEHEWALLEPASYVALVAQATGRNKVRWVQFNRET